MTNNLNVTIQAHGIDLANSMRDHLLQQIKTKIAKFPLKEIKIDVRINQCEGFRYDVRATLVAPGLTIHARDAWSDSPGLKALSKEEMEFENKKETSKWSNKVEYAIDGCIHKLARRLIKLKDKKNRHHEHDEDSFEPEDTSAWDDLSKSVEEDIKKYELNKLEERLPHIEQEIHSKLISVCADKLDVITLKEALDWIDTERNTCDFLFFLDAESLPKPVVKMLCPIRDSEAGYVLVHFA